MPPPPHPLDPLDRRRAAPFPRCHRRRRPARATATRFALVQLVEPPKDDVLAWAPGDADRPPGVARCCSTPRAATSPRSSSRSTPSGCCTTTVVPTDDHPYGQPGLVVGELMTLDEVVKADARWQEAMRSRGVTDLDAVQGAAAVGGPVRVPRRGRPPRDAGHHAVPGGADRHPVVPARSRASSPYVDLDRAPRSSHFADHGGDPIPPRQPEPRRGRVGAGAHEPAAARHHPARRAQLPRSTGRGRRGRAGRSASASTPARASCCTSSATPTAAGSARSSTVRRCPRWSCPTPTRTRCASGSATSTRASTASVAWPARSRSAATASARSTTSTPCTPTTRALPVELPNVVCLHEEDVGVLWKHQDFFSGTSEVRRSRRLVVSSWAAIGNYDYGFFWYLYQDGTIEFDIKLTGIVFAVATRVAGDHAAPVTPELAAPYHQHLFNVRLDMTVDGVRQHRRGGRRRRRRRRAPPTRTATPSRPARRCSTREGDAARLADAGALADVADRQPRHAATTSASRSRYALIPSSNPVLLARPGSSVAKRAVFATRHLWVTRYDPAERYAAGDYPNQHAGGAGLPAYQAADRSLVDEDVVVWHTFGSTHIPRPEDWPGDARRARRVQPQAGQLLRPQPGARPPALVTRRRVLGRDRRILPLTPFLSFKTGPIGAVPKDRTAAQAPRGWSAGRPRRCRRGR